jgi:iron-sulfur cluster repair protein YtfE (RIC family)
LIAYQSVVIGIGLSFAAMLVAAWGYLPPAWGAILQEVIDLAVILNALRALRDTTSASRLTANEAEIARRFSAEHATLRPDLARIRMVADSLDAARPAESLAMVHEIHHFLVDDLAPHEAAEDATLYPALARVLGGKDPTATMSRAHVEIAHLIRRIGRVLDDLDPAGPDDDDITELRRLLYGLHAVLQLHFAKRTRATSHSPTKPNHPARRPKSAGTWRTRRASHHDGARLLVPSTRREAGADRDGHLDGAPRDRRALEQHAAPRSMREGQGEIDDAEAAVGNSVTSGCSRRSVHRFLRYRSGG